MSQPSVAPVSATSERENNVTIFASVGERQAKLIRRDGSVEPAEMRFLQYGTAGEHSVPHFAAMVALLQRMLVSPRAHLVRGGLVGWDGKAVTAVRRLLHSRGGAVPTVFDAPRRWLFLDIDDLAETDTGLDWRDLGSCGAAAVARLPTEFAGRRFIVAATGSHGLADKGPRVRLVFHLSRAVTSAELRSWLGDRAGDPSVLGPAQPVYTARPEREDGGPDHVAERVLLVPGPPGTPVDVEVPPITVTPPRARQASSEVLSDADLEALAQMVRATPNGQEFDGRGRWLGFGHALVATFGETETARGLWLDWCSRWTGAADLDAAEGAWESLLGAPERHAGWWTLAGAAERAGVPLPPVVTRLWQVERLAEAQDEFEATEDMLAEGLTPMPASAASDPAAVASSEDALALMFSRRHAGQALHLANGRGWHTWAGHRWEQDERRAVFDLARLVCRDHARRLDEEDKGSALARRVASAATRAAVLSIASADPRHARSIAEFDADPWLLNSPAGVIDLRTGALRPHQHGEMVTKSTPVAPGGECSTWLRFLIETTQGDAELVSYLQRWFGYSLTGSTVEQQFLFLYGPGGNGKSVIVQTLAATLGDYATTATPDVFTATRSDQHLAHVAALKGARMVIAPETEEGRAWAEGRLKALVAADRQSARFMRGDPFEFTPELKLWICGNHLPRLLNVDDAMRRRTRIVHLTHRPATPDAFLADRLREELGGILAWGVQGCLEWQRTGLGMPSAVSAACDNYFAEQDVFAAWIAERLNRTDPNASEASRDMFADWRDFAMARREGARTETWFGTEIQKHFVRRHTETGKRIFGVRLKPSENEFPI